MFGSGNTQVGDSSRKSKGRRSSKNVTSLATETPHAAPNGGTGNDSANPGASRQEESTALPEFERPITSDKLQKKNDPPPSSTITFPLPEHDSSITTNTVVGDDTGNVDHGQPEQSVGSSQPQSGPQRQSESDTPGNGNAEERDPEFTETTAKKSGFRRMWGSKGKKPEAERKSSKSTGLLSALSRTKQVKVTDITSSDIVIAVMGPTGSGKSSFINAATGYNKGVGHSLESCTSEITAVKLSFPELVASDIYFVDTPGFDDTNKSDLDIFKMISEWLNDTYKNKIHLTALLYFHRISDNRMAGTPLKNLRMFEKLCGKDFKRIVLTTTMWDEVDPEIGARREQELSEQYWSTMIDRGSRVGRFVQTRASAFQILGPLIDEINAHEDLLLQKEMNDMGLTLRQTSAGATLYNELEELVARRQKMLERIREEMKQPQVDEAQLQLLMEEYRELSEKWRIASEDLSKLKMPIGERLKKAFVSSFNWRKFASLLGLGNSESNS